MGNSSSKTPNITNSITHNYQGTVQANQIHAGVGDNLNVNQGIKFNFIYIQNKNYYIWLQYLQ